MENLQKEPAKRGRPVIGDRPMTGAERMKRSRELREAEGAKRFELVIRGDMVTEIEALASYLEITPAKTLERLIDTALGRVRKRTNVIHAALKNGLTYEAALALAEEVSPR